MDKTRTADVTFSRIYRASLQQATLMELKRHRQPDDLPHAAMGKNNSNCWCSFTSLQTEHARYAC